MKPRLRDDEQLRYHRIRLQFDETLITCAPAVIGANPEYGKALIDFRLGSPHRLAIAAAADLEPEEVRDETEALAHRELAQIFADTVVTAWEGPGADDPVAWFLEHPNDFEALVAYCENLEVFRRGVRDGDS